MGKKQTRRSVSMNGALHARLKDVCDRLRRPVSAFVEEAIEHRLAGIEDLDLPDPSTCKVEPVDDGWGAA